MLSNKVFIWATSGYLNNLAMTNGEVIEDLTPALLVDMMINTQEIKCTLQDNSYWNVGVYGVVSNSGRIEGKEISEDWNG